MPLCDCLYPIRVTSAYVLTEQALKDGRKGNQVAHGGKCDLKDIAHSQITRTISVEGKLPEEQASMMACRFVPLPEMRITSLFFGDEEEDMLLFFFYLLEVS